MAFKAFNRSRVPAVNQERARLMRACPTPGEEALWWGALSAKGLGVRFVRQAPIGPFIVDFLAPSARLVVEVDGPYHQMRPKADARRERKLRRAGYRVLRFSEEEVLGNMRQVILHILQELGPPSGAAPALAEAELKRGYVLAA